MCRCCRQIGLRRGPLLTGSGLSACELWLAGEAERVSAWRLGFVLASTDSERTGTGIGLADAPPVMPPRITMGASAGSEGFDTGGAGMAATLSSLTATAGSPSETMDGVASGVPPSVMMEEACAPKHDAAKESTKIVPRMMDPVARTMAVTIAGTD